MLRCRGLNLLTANNKITIMDDVLLKAEQKSFLKTLFSSIEWKTEKKHKVGSVTLPFVIDKGQKISAQCIEDILQDQTPREERVFYKLQIFAFKASNFGLVKYRWGCLTVR